MFRSPNNLFKKILHTKDLKKKQSELVKFSEKYESTCYGLLADAMLAEDINESVELADQAVSRAWSDSEHLYSHFLLAEFLYIRLKTTFDARGIDLLTAEALLKKAISVDPNYRHSKRLLAVYYSNWGRYDSFVAESRESFKYARKTFFNLYRKYKFPLYFNDYWLCIQYNSSPKNALRALRCAERKFPNNPDIMYALGESYAEIGEKKLSDEYYMKAANLNHPYLKNYKKP